MNHQSNQYVYILYNEFVPFVYKIGWTSRTPQKRAEEISQGTGVVGTWKVAHYWFVSDGYWLEQRIFQKFEQYRLPRSEMFHFGGYTVEQIADQISQFINDTGESPKRATEIAIKEKEERKQRKKWEEEQQQAKYTYDAKCHEIKKEISNIIHTNIKNKIKNDPDLKKLFLESVFWWTILGCFVGMFIEHIIGFGILGAIIGCVIYLFEKDKKFHKLQSMYPQQLPDNLEQLIQIKDSISSK